MLVLGSKFCNAYASSGQFVFESNVKIRLNKELSGEDSEDLFRSLGPTDILKNSYISPYNYIQNPVAYNMRTSTIASPNGHYAGAVSVVADSNIFPRSGNNRAINTNTFQLWGQTDRWNGFALGGTLQGAQSTVQVGQPNTYASEGVLSPSQTYIDYKFSNILQFTVGNMLLATPWVSSTNSAPAGPIFTNYNNTYLGFSTDIKVLDSLVLSGFHAYSYIQYPNSFPSSSNLYTIKGGPFADFGETDNTGVTGVAAKWNPTPAYNANLWFYEFSSYANMWYFDNNFRVKLDDAYSMDVGLQALNQSSNDNSIVANITLPGTDKPAGLINSNVIGVKWGLNVPHDFFSISYNNMFGPNGSFLNGGMVTPYTFGLGSDPLYTTPALTSLAEIGSGYAYTVKNTYRMLQDQLAINLSYSSFHINQVFAGQPDAPVTEIDAGTIYNWTKNLNTFARIIYVYNPVFGVQWQPRLIVNYTF